MPPPISDPARVLIVDDEESIREGVHQVLSRQGYEVETAPDGEEALSLLEQSDYDVVLLDLKLPDMDGMEVLRLIREAERDLDVIVITGHGTIETAVAAMKLGAMDIITKPFVPWQLKQVIGRSLELRRLAEERDRLAAEREKGLWVITTEKSRLKAVINSMSEGVLITEPDKAIVLCNPAFTSLMGIGKACVVGSNLADHEQLAILDDITLELMKKGEEIRSITREIEGNGDTPVHIRASVNRVSGEGQEGGRTLGFVTVLEDVTHFKELDREKTAFVAMLSHELKAPLAVMETQINVLLKGLAGDIDVKSRRMILRMKERVGGVIEMINDLLSLASLEHRRFVQERQSVDLSLLVEESCRLMQPRAAERKQALTWDMSTELPPVLADPKSIRDVLVNLLNNAVRYTQEGGSIRIETCVEGGFAAISVIDNGYGIDPADHDKVFDRFFRVKNENTRHIVGTGLGLPIVKAIVEDHRGRLELDSRLNKGSRFTVLLPVSV